LDRAAEAAFGKGPNNHLTRQEIPKFFLGPSVEYGLIKVMRLQYPESICWSITKADEICAHVFDLVGSGKVDLGHKIDWHRDFKSGVRWEPKFYSDIDLTGCENKSDPNVPWKLNRFHHFVDLGKAYWYTDDEKYAREFVDQLEDWIQENPPLYGINWVSIMDVGIRMVNWIWAYFFFKDSPSFGEDTRTRFFKSLLFHGKHIVNNLQYGAHSDNHLLGNLVGLIYFGLMFPEFKSSGRWLKLGLRELYRQTETQVYPDGVDYEMSIGYHRFVLEMFLSSILLCRLNGHNIPIGVMKHLEKMFEFVMYYTKPDGTVPVIGDADDGRLHRLSTKVRQEDVSNAECGLQNAAPAKESYGHDSTPCVPPPPSKHLNHVKKSLEHIDHRYLLSIGAVLFGRGDFKEAVGNFHEEAFWLLGEEGLEKFNEIQKTKEGLQSKGFPHGGFYVMRKDDLYLIADCGYIGKGKYSDIGHGHNDTLSFELFAYDKTFITDSGSYVYSADVVARNEFRKTRAHNTVVVDEEEIAEIEGIWVIRDNTNPKVHKWETTPEHDFFDGEHDGYKRLKDSVIHRRQIYFDKRDGYWIINDMLNGQGTHKFDWYFHFDIGVDVKIEKNLTIRALCNEGSKLILVPFDPAGFDVELLDGFVSKSYGIKQPAKVVGYTTISQAPLTFSVLLYPYTDSFEDALNRVGPILTRSKKAPFFGV